MTDRRDIPPLELATVEAWRNERVPEEFPEGPYGSPRDDGAASGNADMRPEQRPHLPFAYADRSFHEGTARAYPGEDGRPPSADGRSDG